LGAAEKELSEQPFPSDRDGNICSDTGRRGSDTMDRDSLTTLLARGLSVEKIAQRFGRHPSTVAYWMAKYGLEAPNRDKHAAKGGIARDRLVELIERGMSITEIAEAVRLSKATVRYWLGRHGLSTRATERLAAERGRCRQDQVSDNRRRVKAVLVAEAGGGCAVCGYDRCVSALQFHHLDRAEKRMNLSAQGVTLALSVLRAEAAKCVLLCANCHAEVESGLRTLPVE
jgi:transposase